MTDPRVDPGVTGPNATGRSRLPVPIHERVAETLQSKKIK
jgi:hypothetical protein